MIKVTNLYKIFNQNKPNHFEALKNINLDIKQNELVLLKGISGSGKSTMLSIIASFSHPTSGSVVCDGKNIAKLPDKHASSFRSKSIGFIFQSFNLIEELTVEDNVKVPLTVCEDKDISKQTKIAMKQANIYHKKEQKIKNLSGGEKQRVAIARALVNNPNIILADEPTANLDTANSLVFIETIKELKKLGKTIIIATHDSIFDNLSFVDRYLDIIDGTIK